jgi:hypothetical protein
MLKTLTTTATILLIIITPALAQNPDPYPGRDWGFSFSPREEPGNTSEWRITNPYDKPVRVRVNVDNGSYRIGGNQYNSGESSHILFPPNSSTPMIINTDGAKGFNESINVDINPY